VEERFHPATYVKSTGLGATAGPGGIGGEGIIHVRRTLGVKMRIDPKEGASSTSKSLRIDGGDISNTSSSVLKHNPRQLDGPQFRLYKGSQPERVTVFVKMGGLTSGKSSSNMGIMLSLHGRVGDATTTNTTTTTTNSTTTNSTTNTTTTGGGRRRATGVYHAIHGRDYQSGGTGATTNHTGKNGSTTTAQLHAREGVVSRFVVFALFIDLEFVFCFFVILFFLFYLPYL